ncbi:hypothetical protein C8250_028950 [Streptomyces sp. So13.3]|uniref:hypothetical protein n=1 Tax=Streptomyces sp. So13.3 TaxID=2136173 RepID=UPI001106E35D|nr:hypothetical protein [Streptomyces sp. So13.3]QNA75381.1 hypothetical protein C8250_028950 [Streptomyces sp. So13.3]
MTVTSESATGLELAESLLQGAGNEQMRAATRLLGAYRDGYWLHRFAEDQELMTAVQQPLIDISAPQPSVDGDAVGFLMFTTGWGRRASRSELAVLEIAASLVSRCAVQLGQAIGALDDAEFRLILRAIEDAASGEARRREL